MFLFAAYLFLQLAVFSSAEAHTRNCTQEVLKDNLTSPYQLAIDYKSNTLFFSYSVETSEVFKSAYLNLNTKEFGTIPDIHQGFANAVDNKNHVIYLGSKGIYKFDLVSKRAVDLKITNKMIWQLYFKNDIYFTTIQEEAYVYHNGKVSHMLELIGTRVRLLAIDNNHNIFYANSSGMFVLEPSSKKVINLGDHSVNGFHSDILGNIFFSTPSGLYRIKGITNIEQLYQNDDNNIFCVATEADGAIIYASLDSIIRLK